MVHELVGIALNRVDLRHVPGVKPEFAEAVLSARQDPFFRANMYSNFGDLGMAVKELVDTAGRWDREGWWGGAEGLGSGGGGACACDGQVGRGGWCGRDMGDDGTGWAPAARLRSAQHCS